MPIISRILMMRLTRPRVKALAALTDWFDGNADKLEEIEDLLADAVRLATETGDLSTTQAFADRADALAAGSEIPHRQANMLYCGGLLNHDAAGLLAAAKRYDDAGRPLQKAKALEAAARQFFGVGDRGQARAAFTRAVEVYSSLGAAADVSRLQATFRAHGILRGPHSNALPCTPGGVIRGGGGRPGAGSRLGATGRYYAAGVRFIRWPAPLFSQSPPEINDDRQPSARVPPLPLPRAAPRQAARPFSRGHRPAAADRQSGGDPGVIRSFGSVMAAAGEAALSRIFAGQYTMTDLVAGRQPGRHAGGFVLGHFGPAPAGAR